MQIKKRVLQSALSSLQLVASWCQTERDMKRVPWLSGLQAEDKWGEVH